eukprot:g8620.t1
MDIVCISRHKPNPVDIEMQSCFLRVVPTPLQPERCSVSIPRSIRSPKITNYHSLRARCLCPTYGVRAVAGRRARMEDAVSIIERLFEVPRIQSTKESYGLRGSIQTSLSSPPGKVLSLGRPQDREVFNFFGLYDGHNGPYAANHCRGRLHENLRSIWFEKVRESYGGTLNDEMFLETFKRTDQQFSKYRCAERVGTTALIALVNPQYITVASCGDSRAVLYRSGHSIQMSNDHRLDEIHEKNRIESCGGRITYWNGPRVMGILAMSRAIGDLSFRRYGVICDPEVKTKKRSINDEYLLLATDGLWDVITNDEAYRIIRHTIVKNQKENLSPLDCVQNAANRLVRVALDRGSRDNITVVLLDLQSDHHHQTADLTGEDAC